MCVPARAGSDETKRQTPARTLDEDGGHRALARHLREVRLDRVAPVHLVELDDRRVDLKVKMQGNMRERGRGVRASRLRKTRFVLSQKGQ